MYRHDRTYLHYMLFKIFFVGLTTGLPVLFAEEGNQGCDEVEHFSLLQVAHRMTHKKSVAVFVSGTLLRYQRTSAAKHLVSPLVKQNYQVDYYLHLNASNFQSWQTDASRYRSDPVFVGLGEDELKKAVADPFIHAGATVQSLIIAGEGPLNMTDDEKSFVSGTSNLGRRLWNEDCTGAKPKKIFAARQNFLLRFKGLERLWHKALDVETQFGFQYDYVIVHQDDAAWVHDFDFNAFLSSHGASESDGSRAFSVTCGQGSSYETHKNEIIDSIWILERQAAVPYLTLYHSTIWPESSGLDVGQTGLLSICDSEIFEKMVGDYHQVKMFKVPSSSIPLQRVGRIMHRGEMITCYHYVCGSNLLGVPIRSHMFDNMLSCEAYQ